MQKITLEQIDEVNMLFEMIKTVLITWLSKSKIRKLLKTHTHYEIRYGQYIKGKFIVNDIIIHDAEFQRQKINLVKN